MHRARRLTRGAAGSDTLHPSQTTIVSALLIDYCLAALGFGTAFTFLSVFGIGEVVFFSLWKGMLLLAGAAVSAYVVFVLVRETFRQMQEENPAENT